MIARVSRLAKLLASNEMKNRKLGYKCACDLLKLQPGNKEVEVSYTDILGVCKGLYYSLWMQDKPLLQEDAVARIVKLIGVIKNRKVRSMYIKGIFETLAKEWDSLDFWRQNKFMMLVRDFLVRCIVSIKKKAVGVETVADAIFKSILNADANSCVELKLHLIIVMKEELLKAGNVPSLVNAFFKHSLEKVQKMPKGSAYATDMITLVIFLAKQMRKYPNFPLDKISEELLELSAKVTMYRKSFLRIAKLLHVKKSRKRQKKTLEAPLKAGSIEASVTVSKPSGPCKRKLVVENDTAFSERSEISQKLQREIPNGSSVNDASNIPENNVQPPEAKKIKLSMDEIQKIRTEKSIPTINRIKTVENTHEPENIPQNTTQKSGLLAPNEESTVSSLEPLKDSVFNIVVEPDHDMSVLDSFEQTTPQKRVSFGKVFCKKFSSSKKLNDRPIPPLAAPSRGILRR